VEGEGCVYSKECVEESCSIVSGGGVVVNGGGGACVDDGLGW